MVWRGSCGIPLWILLQVLVILLGSQVEHVGGVHASAQCVQLGQANDNAMRHWTYTEHRRSGPWTIGTRKFDIKYDYLDYISDYRSSIIETVQDCPYQTVNNLPSNPCPTDKQVQIRTYVVNQDGKVMTGWLHFEVELVDPKDSILAIYVQVRDEYFNAIGEFVTHREEQCEPDDALVQPTEYQILPCAAVGFREAKISNAIFMAERHVYRNQTRGANIDDFIPKESIGRGIHFTWRMSEYWCNRHLRLRPEATILTKKMVATQSSYTDPKVYRKAAAYWIFPRWFGAADIKLPATTLLCNEQVIDYRGVGTLEKDKKTGKLVAPWLNEKALKSRLANDYISPSQYYLDTRSGRHTLKSCQFDTRKVKPGDKDTVEENAPYVTNTLPTFAGRCTHHYEKTPSHDALQGCNLDTTAPEFEDLLQSYPNITTYGNYVNELTGNRTRYCSLECRTPNAANDTDLNAIRNYTDHSGEGNFTEIVRFHSDSRKKAMFEKFWKVSCDPVHRLDHVPHSTWHLLRPLLQGDLHEPDLHGRPPLVLGPHCYDRPFFHAVHLVAEWNLEELETWGRSTHTYSNAHRGIGYFSAVLFFLMIILGGFRPTLKVPRLILMTAHSILGFLIYFFNILAMIFAGYIPASPSMGDCDLEGNSTKESGVFYVIVIWIVMDSLLHGVMTALQVMKDTQAGVRRRWYCPIIPIMPFNSADDFIGSKIRKITLLIYAATAFVMTFTAVALVNNPELPVECWNRTGPTTCAEKFGCSGEGRGYWALVKAKTRNTSGHYVFEEGFW